MKCGNLVKNIFIEGEDSFTDTMIEYSVRDLTTRISTDPLFSLGKGEIVE